MHRVINEDEFRGVTLTRFSPSQLTPRKGMTHSQWQPSGVMNFVPPFAQINVSQSMATSAASKVQHFQTFCFVLNLYKIMIVQVNFGFNLFEIYPI